MRRSRQVGQEARDVRRRQLVERAAGRLQVADDPIVDIGDVHHPRDLVARPAQVAADAGRPAGRRGSCRRATGRRRSARTSTCARARARAARIPRACPPRVLVKRAAPMSLGAHHRRCTPTSAVALITRPAPSAPLRLPVDAAIDTASTSSPTSWAIRAAHLVEPPTTEPRPGTDDCHLRPIDPPARLRRPLTASATSSALAMPAVARIARREEAAEIAQTARRRGSPSPARASTTSPSEWPYSRGASAIEHAAQPQAVVRAEAMAVLAQAEAVASRYGPVRPA